MQASELARWTRFARRGGIGKCTAIQDCVAESSEDLMFLKDDEITVLVQIPENEGLYLGYCEGVVGKFQAHTVNFHSKLKRPVMTKRNSRVKSPTAASSSSTPVSSNPATPLTPVFAARAPSPKRNSSLDVQSQATPQSSKSSTVSKSAHPETLTPQTAQSTSTVAATAPRHAYTPSIAVSEMSQHSTSTSTVDVDYGLPRVMSPPSMYGESNLHTRQLSMASVLSSESSVRNMETRDVNLFPKRSDSLKSSRSTTRSKSPSIYQSSGQRKSTLSIASSDHDPRISIASATSDGEIGIGLSLMASLGEGDSDDEDFENEVGRPNPGTATVEPVEGNIINSGSSTGSLNIERAISSSPISPSPISEDAVSAFPRPPSTQIAVVTSSDPVNPFGTFGQSTAAVAVRGGLDRLFGALGLGTHEPHASVTSSESLGTGSIESKEMGSSESGGTTALGHPSQNVQHDEPEEVNEIVHPRSPALSSVRSDSEYSSVGQRPSPIQPIASGSELSPTSPTFPPPNFRFPAQRPDADTPSVSAITHSDILPPHSPTFSSASGASVSEWEGASDIYDNYLYRFSMASKNSRLSQMSVASKLPRSIPSTSTMPPAGTIPRPLSSPTMSSSSPFSVQTSSKLEAVQPAENQSKSAELENSLYTSLSADSADTSTTITPSQIPPRYDSLTMQRAPSVSASSRSLHSRRSVASSHYAGSPHQSDESDDESIYSRLSSKPSLSLLEAHAAALLENQERVNTTSALNVVKNSPSPSITTFEKIPSVSKNRPSPLDLTKDQARASNTTHGIAGPSPLLHTRWGSPVSSTGMSTGSVYDDKSSGGYPTPPIEIMHGSEDDKTQTLLAGLAAPSKGEHRQSHRAETADPVRAHNDPDSSSSTNRPLVIEDDEELPSHAIDPQEGEMDMSLTTMESSDLRYADGSMSDIDSTPFSSPKNKNESLGVTPLLISSSPSSPSLQVTSPTSSRSGMSGSSPNSVISPGDGNLDSASTPPPSPSPIRPIPRPSLAELRGYPDSAVEGQRRSLFLPHPNSPRAPLESPGPMYIRDVDSSQLHELNQVRQGPDPKKIALHVMHMALNTPPPAMSLMPPPSSMPIRGTNKRGNPPAPLPRGPTIYARVDVDLSTSNGPVPITFGVEPMGPPPLPLYHSPDNTTANLPGAMQPPVSPRAQLPPTIQYQRLQVPQVNSVKRSVTASASLPTTSFAGGSPPLIPGSVPQPLSRDNFTPRASSSRPRSKSFSAGSNPPATVDDLIPIPNSSNSVPLRTRGSSTSLASSPPVPSPSSPTKDSFSPLRPSSLGKPASNSKLRNVFSPSPLSLPFNDSSISPLMNGVPKSPSSPLLGPSRPSQLRKVTSLASLPSGSPPSAKIPPLKSLTDAGHVEKPPKSPTAISRQSNDEPKDSDVMSVTSSRSQAMSPPPVGRRTSLQSKLSMPNLRRGTMGREDNFSSPIAENETLQVQDMDFELVRPNFPVISSRSSEDSNSGFGRKSESRTAEGGSTLFRPESPAISISSGISGTSRITTGVSSDSAAFRSKASIRASDSEASMDAHRQREQKWMTLISTVPAVQARKNKKTRKLLGEGVPSSVRYLVWAHLTNAKSKGVAGVYSQLSKRVRVAAFADMERDVKRCFGEHPHLQSTEGPLISLLQAYLTMVPDVQYSTGLTLIAGHTLLLAPEEDAFWIFVSVMDSALRPYFSPNSTQMEVDAALFSRALEANDAQVSRKVLVDMSINPAHICFPWFTTLFVSTLPGDYVNRVWDLFLYEGIPILIRVGLAILYCCRRVILEATSEDAVLYYLKRPSPTWLPPTPDAFMTLAFSFKVKDDEVRKQRVKMEKQVKKQTQGQGARLAANGISLPREG